MNKSQQFSIDPRAGDIEPVEPGWNAIAEKKLWGALYGILCALIIYAGYKSGLLSFVFDSDGSFSIAGGVVILAVALSVDFVGKRVTAWRRYGYSPSEYKLAKRRARGQALTPEEAKEKQAEWQLERAEDIEQQLNDLVTDLGELNLVETELQYEDGQFSVNSATSRVSEERTVE